MKIEEGISESELIEEEAWTPTEGDISQMGIESSFDLYVREAMQEPLLNWEQEKELGEKMVRGGEAKKRLEKGNVNGDREALAKDMEIAEVARERLIRSNTRLVLSRASKYWCPGRSLPDLTQGGNIGLLEAVKRFDPKFGVRFSTYATWWIDRDIRTELRNSDRLIHLPKGAEIYAKVLKQVLHEFDLEHRPMIYEDIAKEVAERTAHVKDDRVVSVEMIKDFMTTEYIASLNKELGDDEQTAMWEIVKDESIPEVLDEVGDVELKEIFDELLSYLDPREERVIRMRYGFDSGEEMSYQSIGEDFELSREWARLEKNHGLAKLKAWANARDLKVFWEEE